MRGQVRVRGVSGLRCDLVMDELVHLLHRGRELFFASVCATKILAILLLGAFRLQRLSVLGRDDHGMDVQRLDRAVRVLLVLDCDLRLAIGAKPPERTIFAHICELLAELGRHQMRERHAVLGLVGGVAEHDALRGGKDGWVRGRV